MVGEAGFDCRANLFFLHKNAFAFLATPKSFAFCAFRLSVSFFFMLFSKRKKGLPATTRLSAGYSNLAKLPAHTELILSERYIKTMWTNQRFFNLEFSSKVEGRNIKSKLRISSIIAQSSVGKIHHIAHFF